MSIKEQGAPSLLYLAYPELNILNIRVAPWGTSSYFLILSAKKNHLNRLRCCWLLLFIGSASVTHMPRPCVAIAMILSRG